MDGGNGYVYVNYGEDLHAYGPTAPLLPGGYGCVSIDPMATAACSGWYLTRWHTISRSDA